MKQHLNYKEDVRRGIMVAGILRSVHKAGVVCEAGPRRKLETDDWSKVTCKHCLKRKKPRTGRGRLRRDKRLPKGVRFVK